MREKSLVRTVGCPVLRIICKFRACSPCAASELPCRCTSIVQALGRETPQDRPHTCCASRSTSTPLLWRRCSAPSASAPADGGASSNTSSFSRCSMCGPPDVSPRGVGAAAPSRSDDGPRAGAAVCRVSGLLRPGLLRLRERMSGSHASGCRGCASRSRLCVSASCMRPCHSSPLPPPDSRPGARPLSRGCECMLTRGILGYIITRGSPAAII